MDFFCGTKRRELQRVGHGSSKVEIMKYLVGLQNTDASHHSKTRGDFGGDAKLSLG